MRCHFRQIDNRGLDPLLVNLGAVSILRNIAFCLGELLHEFGLDLALKKLAREMHDAARVLNHLNGLDTGDLIKKPAAAGVHQHRVPLHLQQLKRSDLFLRTEIMGCVLVQETLHVIRRPVEDDVNVVIACRPRVFQKRARFVLVLGRDRAPQEIERRTQRGAPFLIPSGVARIATTITPPPLHAVLTAPGSVLDDLDLMGGRMKLQEIPVVGGLSQFVCLDIVQRIGERHFAKPMMVSIALTVRRDVNDLRPGPGVGKTADQALGKFLSAIQQTFESHRP